MNGKIITMHKFTKFLKKIFSKTFFIILIVLFALSLFFFWVWYEQQFDKAKGMYYVYKGDKAYHKGQLQNAIDLYKKGLDLYPEHYGAWYNLGNIYVVYEDYYAAADAYSEAIEHNPKFTLARMNLGIIDTEKLGDFDGAINQYKSIIDTKHNLLGIPFIFNNTKSSKENKGLAYYNMGVAYRQKSLYEGQDKKKASANLLKAIESYEKATKILKNNYDVRYNLAIAYHLAGNFNNAGSSYCKAIQLEPMKYEAHYNLAILLRHLKMYQEAYSEIEKATILITDGHTDSNTSSYVFDVLNEISRLVTISENYDNFIEKINKERSFGKVTYVNGKIVATDDLDAAILNNLKKCETEKFFKD